MWIGLALLSLALEGQVAITAKDSKPDSDVEALFGRARWILIYDAAKSTWQEIDNSAAAQAAGGAGVQTAQVLVQRGVKVLLTGQCGPKAMHALSAAGIKIFKVTGGTVAEALRDYQAGRLKPLDSP
jgi:predicted Fe-Mo cluster-binding NifX family protein